MDGHGVEWQPSMSRRNASLDDAMLKSSNTRKMFISNLVTKVKEERKNGKKAVNSIIKQGIQIVEAELNHGKANVQVAEKFCRIIQESKMQAWTRDMARRLLEHVLRVLGDVQEGAVTGQFGHHYHRVVETVLNIRNANHSASRGCFLYFLAEDQVNDLYAIYADAVYNVNSDQEWQAFAGSRRVGLAEVIRALTCWYPSFPASTREEAFKFFLEYFEQRQHHDPVVYDKVYLDALTGFLLKYGATFTDGEALHYKSWHEMMKDYLVRHRDNRNGHLSRYDIYNFLYTCWAVINLPFSHLSEEARLSWALEVFNVFVVGDLTNRKATQEVLGAHGENEARNLTVLLGVELYSGILSLRGGMGGQVIISRSHGGGSSLNDSRRVRSKVEVPAEGIAEDVWLRIRNATSGDTSWGRFLLRLLQVCPRATHITPTTTQRVKFLNSFVDHFNKSGGRVVLECVYALVLTTTDHRKLPWDRVWDAILKTYPHLTDDVSASICVRILTALLHFKLARPTQVAHFRAGLLSHFGGRVGSAGGQSYMGFLDSFSRRQRRVDSVHFIRVLVSQYGVDGDTDSATHHLQTIVRWCCDLKGGIADDDYNRAKPLQRSTGEIYVRAETAYAYGRAVSMAVSAFSNTSVRNQNYAENRWLSRASWPHCPSLMMSHLLNGLRDPGLSAPVSSMADDFSFECTSRPWIDGALSGTNHLIPSDVGMKVHEYTVRSLISLCDELIKESGLATTSRASVVVTVIISVIISMIPHMSSSSDGGSCLASQMMSQCLKLIEHVSANMNAATSRGQAAASRFLHCFPVGELLYQISYEQSKSGSRLSSCFDATVMGIVNAINNVIDTTTGASYPPTMSPNDEVNGDTMATDASGLSDDLMGDLSDREESNDLDTEDSLDKLDIVRGVRALTAFLISTDARAENDHSIVDLEKVKECVLNASKPGESMILQRLECLRIICALPNFTCGFFKMILKYLQEYEKRPREDLLVRIIWLLNEMMRCSSLSSDSEVANTCKLVICKLHGHGDENESPLSYLFQPYTLSMGALSLWMQQCSVDDMQSWLEYLFGKCIRSLDTALAMSSLEPFFWVMKRDPLQQKEELLQLFLFYHEFMDARSDEYSILIGMLEKTAVASHSLMAQCIFQMFYAYNSVSQKLDSDALITRIRHLITSALKRIAERSGFPSYVDLVFFHLHDIYEYFLYGIDLSSPVHIEENGTKLTGTSRRSIVKFPCSFFGNYTKFETFLLENFKRESQNSYGQPGPVAPYVAVLIRHKEYKQLLHIAECLRLKSRMLVSATLTAAYPLVLDSPSFEPAMREFKIDLSKQQKRHQDAITLELLASFERCFDQERLMKEVKERLSKVMQSHVRVYNIVLGLYVSICQAGSPQRREPLLEALLFACKCLGRITWKSYLIQFVLSAFTRWLCADTSENARRSCRSLEYLGECLQIRPDPNDEFYNVEVGRQAHIITQRILTFQKQAHCDVDIVRRCCTNVISTVKGVCSSIDDSNRSAPHALSTFRMNWHGMGHKVRSDAKKRGAKAAKKILKGTAVSTGYVIREDDLDKLIHGLSMPEFVESMGEESASLFWSLVKLCQDSSEGSIKARASICVGLLGSQSQNFLLAERLSQSTSLGFPQSKMEAKSLIINTLLDTLTDPNPRAVLAAHRALKAISNVLREENEKIDGLREPKELFQIPYGSDADDLCDKFELNPESSLGEENDKDGLTHVWLLNLLQRSGIMNDLNDNVFQACVRVGVMDAIPSKGLLEALAPWFVLSACKNNRFNCKDFSRTIEDILMKPSDEEMAAGAQVYLIRLLNFMRKNKVSIGQSLCNVRVPPSAPRPHLMSMDFRRLARAAYDTKQFATAVMYLEMYYDGMLDDLRRDDDALRLYFHAVSRLNDPDAVYSVDGGSDVLGTMKLYKKQHNVEKVITSYEMLMRESSNMYTHLTGLYSYLSGLGCVSLTNAIRQTDAGIENSYELNEMHYESAWKMGNWYANSSAAHQNPVEGAAGFHESIYRTLRAIHEGQAQVAAIFLHKGLAGLVDAVEGFSLENSGDIMPILGQIRSIIELSDILSSGDTMSHEVLRTYWDDELRNLEDFAALETPMNVRKSLLEVVNSGNDCFHHCRYVSSKAESLGMNSSAIMFLNSAKIWKEHASAADEMKLQLQEARVLWNYGDHQRAISMLQASIEGEEDLPMDEDEDTLVLAQMQTQLGVWWSSKHLVNSDQIFDTLMKGESKTRSNSFQSDEIRCECLLNLARFADSLYQHEDSKKSSEESRELHELLKKQADRISKAKDDQEMSRLLRIENSRLKSQLQSYLKSEEVYSKYVCTALENYISVLELTDEYDEEITLRILSIWFKNHQDQKVTDIISSRVVDAESGMMLYKFVGLARQIVCRVDIQEANQGSKLHRLIMRIVEVMGRIHPYHVTSTINMLRVKLRKKDPKVKIRVKSAKHILDQWRGSNEALKSIVAAIKLTHEAYMELADRVVERGDNGTNSKNFKEQDKLMELYGSNPNANVFDMTCPLVSSNIPVNVDGQYENVPTIQKIDRQYKILTGKSKPKKIFILDSHGCTHMELVKGYDDVRQDAVVLQVFDIINCFLKKDKEARKRQLALRTYRVIPLTQFSGVVQWVQSRMLIEAITEIHGAYGKYDASDNNLKGAERLMSKAEEEKRGTLYPKKFEAYRKICTFISPLFRYYFAQNFPLPLEWNAKRTLYSRSVAVSSMVGYVLGIGDRHGSNILIDPETAELVHIDFGYAFDQGHDLKLPERVPFRLTREIVDGMGICGTQGVFRRCCEQTVSVLRKNMNAIHTVVEVLVYDPVLDLAGVADQHGDGNHDQQGGGTGRMLLKLRQKLQGYVEGEIYSVEGIVNKLIDDATDPDRLSQMYSGWRAWL